jgi:hypothetical protein
MSLDCFADDGIPEKMAHIGSAVTMAMIKILDEARPRTYDEALKSIGFDPAKKPSKTIIAQRIVQRILIKQVKTLKQSSI